MKQYGLLFPDLSFSVLAIFRGADHINPDLDVQLHEGDEVHLLVERAQIARVLAAFGHEEKNPSNITIMGGGNVGLSLARHLRETLPEIYIKMIEQDAERAQFLSETLNDVLVINGDGVTQEIIEEAGIDHSDMLITVTQNDEENILGALLAKQAGCKRSISLINKDVYAGLVLNYGIDAVVNPRSITVSNILQHVRRGRIKSVHSIRDGAAELIEAEASETCDIVNQSLFDVTKNTDIIPGAIIRKDGEVIFPTETTKVEVGDHVILLAPQDQAEDVEKLFSSSIELF
jgi:trk system potassium uptake protein TrkA